jgi:hypothetical protein
MTITNRLASLLLPLLTLVVTSAAQVPTALDNPGFERGSPGQTLPGWFVPQPAIQVLDPSASSG